MLARPRFRPDAEIRILPGEGVFVVAEQGTVLLTGRLYELVAPLIDGVRTPRDIAASLTPVVSPAEVYYALELLERKGYAVEATEGLSRGESALFAAQHLDPAEAVRRLGTSAVAVITLGGVTACPRPLLESMKLCIADEGDVLLVATDDYLQADLAAINESALHSGRSWMLLRPLGLQLLIGPIFHPHRSGCWECLAARLRLTRTVEDYLEAATGQALPSRGGHCATDATNQVAWTIGASRLVQWIASDRSARFEGEILSVDVLAWQTQTHTLVRRPQCAACGEGVGSRTVGQQPLQLVSRPKLAPLEGDHRTATSSATLARLHHHVSPYTGIVTSLDRVSEVFGDAFHVYAAAHGHALQRQSVRDLRSSLRHCSAGAGQSETDARTSALCEAIERHSAVFDGSEPRVRGTLAGLGDVAIHPNACMLFSDRQYRERDRWNANGSIYAHVPARFDETADTDWTPLWSLTRGQVRYLPTRLCFFDVPGSDAQVEPGFVACSNGNAAGNSLEEAILRGLFEVVERDSVALWWYNRLRRPGVDLDSFSSAHYRHLEKVLWEQHREYWALDLTADFAIPAFAAISRRTDRPRETIALGFGAHLDPRVALSRAVTEMNLMLSWPVLEAPAATRARVLDSSTHRWLESANVTNQPYLLPDADLALVTPDTHARAWTDDVLGDLDECRRRIETQGHEILVLDQTRPDLGLPVAKVVVPGLRHFWARLAPGRLYEVPVRLGWLPAPLAETELNPIPMFI